MKYSVTFVTRYGTGTYLVHLVPFVGQKLICYIHVMEWSSCEVLFSYVCYFKTTCWGILIRFCSFCWTETNLLLLLVSDCMLGYYLDKLLLLLGLDCMLGYYLDKLLLLLG